MNRQFRDRFATPRLTADQAERQGRVSRMAFDALHQPQAVIAFLNTHDEALGGRPIDLAVAGEDGVARIKDALMALPAA